MALSPRAQLGLPFTARARPTVRSTRPVVSRMAISLVPPYVPRVAAMRVPACDQRGSLQTVSGQAPVSGAMRAAPPTTRTRTRREAPGASWTATTSRAPVAAPGSPGGGAGRAAGGARGGAGVAGGRAGAGVGLHQALAARQARRAARALQVEVGPDRVRIGELLLREHARPARGRGGEGERVAR